MNEGRDPIVRLMEAVRYARSTGLTDRDIVEIVDATLVESYEPAVFDSDNEGKSESRYSHRPYRGPAA